MSRTLTLIAQFAGWPLAFSLSWFWLSMPEGSVLQFVLSVLLALLVLILTGALIAGALGAWGAVWRVLPWLIAAGLFSAVASWRGWNPMIAVAPWLIALPGFFRACGGPAYRESLTRLATYAGIVVWCGLAVALPWKLLTWVPDVGPAMGAQAASAAVRFFLAGLSFVLAWLGLGAYWRSAFYAKD